MGRSQNPVDVHRRQERKKQLQKNKTTRIQARDERVKQEKTVVEVKNAINDLKKRGNLNHSEKKKLERLEKELKLVKQAQKERTGPTSSYQPPQKLTELDDPRMSVYWDEKLNPYGAPPPGKPRLYHKQGGGVTMDIALAVVPGQEQQHDVQQHTIQALQGVPERQPQEEASTHVPPPPPPPPPQKEEPKVPPPPPPPPRPKEPVPPQQPPSLPPPSKAVQRMKKRTRMQADIWASTEEVEYHRAHDDLDLEGNTTTTNWYYQDSSGKLQGPFTSLQMHSWFQAGFFPATTPVRKGDRQNFVPMSKIDWNAQVQKATAKEKKKSTVDDRITALKQPRDDENEEQDSVESRIAALCQEKEQEANVDAVESRIAALRQEKEQEANEDTVESRIAALRKEKEQEGQVLDEDTVESRIAALRKEKELEAHKELVEQETGVAEMPQEVDQEASVEERIAALRAEREQQEMAEHESSVQDRIEALRAEEQSSKLSHEHTSANVAHGDELPSYPVPLEMSSEQANSERAETNEPPPAYYPLPDDMDAVAPYPSDVQYPVSDAYPVDDDGYPSVTDPYPADDGGVPAYPLADDAPMPPKKMFKADKAVVGLVPSNLRRRAPQKSPRPAQAKPKQQNSGSSKEKRSVADDYDEFMKDIAKIK